MSAGIFAEIEQRRSEFAEGAHNLRTILGMHGPVAHDLSRRAIAVESSAKDHATGRPGPNVISGRLRGSITWRLGEDELGLYADIGTNVEYAARIELGYQGTDSLGRTYDSPAYPFLRPGLEAAGL